MTQAIRVKGLNEFVRGLKQVDSSLPKMLRGLLNEAVDLVIDDARPRVPHRTGRAARSIRKASTATKVRLRMGGSRALYMPWLDFGGRVGRNRSVVRRFYKDGRYVYKSYFELKRRGVFQEAMSKAITRTVEAAGIEVD